MNAKARWLFASSAAGLIAAFICLLAVSRANAEQLPIPGLIPMGRHMRMTPKWPRRPGDLDRAHYVADTLRRSLLPYRNYRVALAQGMRVFLPSVPQDVYHFVDLNASGEEYKGHFDLTHPGSLLYAKDQNGYELVGAMYSAPPYFTLRDLNQLVPLSVARWHVHASICLPRGISLNDLVWGRIGADNAHTPGMLPASYPQASALNHELGFMADGRFGFEGTITTASQCDAAGGHFIPQAFGWMVHVYPFTGDDLKKIFAMKPPKPQSDASLDSATGH